MQDAARRASGAAMLPGIGAPVRSLRCQYTLTPDRDFVLGAVPGHGSVVVGLGAAHGFKFAPTFGRVLADLVTDRRDHDRRVGVPARPAGAHRPRVRSQLDGLSPSRFLSAGRALASSGG